MAKATLEFDEPAPGQISIALLIDGRRIDQVDPGLRVGDLSQAQKAALLVHRDLIRRSQRLGALRAVVSGDDMELHA